MNRIEFIATYYGKEHQELKTLEEIEELTTELINNIRTVFLNGENIRFFYTKIYQFCSHYRK